MCLNPTFIVNPAYKQAAHTFQYLYFDGDRRENLSVGDFFYPSKVPHTSKLHTFCAERIDQFYAITPDGECVNIYLEVPCGRCLDCLQKKQSDWRNRMRCEQCLSDEPPLLLTLTYNNEHLPSDGVCKRDVSLFFNRLHTALARDGKDSSFRHVCFSEYGSLHGRPHYHAILFGIDLKQWAFEDKDFVKLCERCWSVNPRRKENTRESLGFVDLRIRDGRAFNYVSKYVGKQMVESVPVHHYERNPYTGIDEPVFMNPNFVVSSRRFGGIGTRWLKHPEFLKMVMTDEFPRVTVRDRSGFIYTMVLPKYLRDKLYPTLSLYIPYRVKRILKCLALDLLVYREQTGRNAWMPQSLCDKFSVISHYCRIDYWEPEKEDYFSRFPHFDLVGVTARIKESLKILKDFYLDEDEVLRVLVDRFGYTRKFFEMSKRYYASQPQYSSGSRHDFFTSLMLKDYKNRMKDLQ